ncbi:MAG: EAL domain-containing protein [Gammaproteobacteria bacterium]|nr:EAL domain-containing protein [Gammaproteobacteria bacterium]
MSVLILTVFIISVYFEEQEHISHDINRSFQSVDGHYQAALKARGHKLGAALESIAINPEFLFAFSQHDRKTLLKLGEPLFKKLKLSHNVTHFYFHDSQRINLLRIHQPTRNNDLINRFTMLGAEKTKDFFYGIELGPLGTFTLRAVLPVWNKGKLLGYIELGEEIDDVIKDIQQVFNVHLIVIIDKQYLHKADWISGMKLLGRKHQWDKLADSVIITQTFKKLPRKMNSILSRHQDHLAQRNFELEGKGKYFRGSFLPLLDAGNRSIGQIVLLRDITERIKSAQEAVINVIIISIIIGIFLFLFVYYVLDRTERQLKTSVIKLKESQEHLTHAQNISHMGSWTLNISNNTFEYSDEIYNIFELDPLSSKPITHETFMQKVHSDDYAALQQCMHNSLVSGEPFDIVFRIILNNGMIKYLRQICEVRCNENSEPLSATCIIHDITKSREADILSARMGNIFEHSWNEIYTFNTDTLKFIEVSKEAQKNLDYTTDELQQLTPVDIMPEISREQFLTSVEPLRDGDKQKVYFETLHKRKNGSTYPVEVRLQISKNETPSIFTSIIQDVSERNNYIKELEHKAMYDSLTDLPNRTLLHDYISHSIEKAAVQDSTVTILIVDIVSIREINDVMGHNNGDVVLKKVAERLVKEVSNSGTVSRLGGDEFAILLPDVSAKNINTTTNKIQRLFKKPIIIDDTPIELEAAIGIAFYPSHGDEPDILLRHADIATQAAKNDIHGFNIYNPGDDPYNLRKIKLYGELRETITAKKLELYYQPKIDIKSGKIKSVEALARWPHPTEGMIPPVDFIPMIEQTGMIRPFTLWVLEQAIIQIRSWIDSGIHLSIAVNLSMRNLLDPSLPDYLGQLLKDYQVDAEMLSLEITESAVMSHPESAIALLEHLHDMGFKLSIDDFGTGYSSLTYLKKLPVHELKIDKSFIMGLTTNEDDAVIVRSTIDLAHNLGLTTVAEGIEEKDIYNILSALGCDVGQGYYFSRPIPSEQLSHWLTQSEWGLI